MAVVLEKRARDVRKPCVAVMDNWCSSPILKAGGGEVAYGELDGSIGDGNCDENDDIDKGGQRTNAEHLWLRLGGMEELTGVERAEVRVSTPLCS